MNKDYELRECRSEVNAKENFLRGYAAVFDEPARICNFTEVIQRGAFAESLKNGADILCLVDHDFKAVIGRTAAGTLKLWEDDHGLAFEVRLPDTTAARDIRALVESGNAGGCSFGFTVPDGGETWKDDTRTITQADLLEISIVQAFPAYGGTSVNVREDLRERKSAAQMRLFIETV